MASTTVTLLRDYPTALTLKLSSRGGTGTPNASGYALTNSNGEQTGSVTEDLVGVFYAYAIDSLGDIAAHGYVLLADDTGTYRVEDSVEVLKIPRAAAAVTAGAAQQKHLENSLGATLQTVYEVHDGDVA